MRKDPDVIVIGAGASGLSAAAMLGQAGLAVTILEARNRIGGRIFKLRDPVCDAPVELGAEFIHGRPPEIWNLLRTHKVRTTEVDGDNWCLNDGQLNPCDFFSEVDEILNRMDARKPDQSFVAFLESCCPQSRNNPPRQAKQWAISYVSGFNAADPALVSVHWLVHGMRAEKKIEGDRAFRSQNGFAALIEILLKQTKKAGITIQQNTVVEEVRWRRGQVEIAAKAPHGTKTFSASKMLITVPLGVLQARSEENGFIRFLPTLPRQKRSAIRNIAMGKVIRITLRFRQRFWEQLPTIRRKDSKTMAGMSFLFSQDDWFPTWWTTAPKKLPFLVVWAPFHCAERLSGQSTSFVAGQALQALHRVLAVSVSELESLLEVAYCHDWQGDPFSRGAYSYGKVAGEDAQLALATPLENTLFFAGEATDTGTTEPYTEPLPAAIEPLMTSPKLQASS